MIVSDDFSRGAKTAGRAAASCRRMVTAWSTTARWTPMPAVTWPPGGVRDHGVILSRQVGLAWWI
jgi:hypothetical protein